MSLCIKESIFCCVIYDSYRQLCNYGDSRVTIEILIGHCRKFCGLFVPTFCLIMQNANVFLVRKSLFLNHSIISPLCLVWLRAPLWPHVRQAKFCLRVCQVVFLGVLPFSPHRLIGPSHMS